MQVSSLLNIVGAGAGACEEFHRQCRCHFRYFSKQPVVPVKNSTAGAGAPAIIENHRCRRKCQCLLRISPTVPGNRHFLETASDESDTGSANSGYAPTI